MVTQVHGFEIFFSSTQVDPEEGEPTEEQSKFQSIGIQVEDEQRW